MRTDAVILAGGLGQRFWPLSRELSPKQMLSVFGGASLVTRAIMRVAPFVSGGGAIHVVTSERLRDELQNHLLSQPVCDTLPVRIVVEPAARNTAPALALAAARIERDDPEATVIMLPSDHLITQDEAWRHTMESAVSAAADGTLVVVGLVPHEPATGYGYIRREDSGASRADARYHPYRVREFVEKPDLETAEEFVAAGTYLWNSGMLVARADAILAALERAGDEARTDRSSEGRRIARLARELASCADEDACAPDARERYRSLPRVSFDHAVLEVSDDVVVIPSDIEWSDVGDLRSVERLAAPDEDGNVTVGNVCVVETKDSTVYTQGRLVATLGVEDLLVVDTDDATLIAPRERAQDVRLVVEALAANNASEVVESRESIRPWGSWNLMLEGPGYRVKRILVRPGKRLSLQSHEWRSEHWVVISGSARVECDGETRELATGESAFIPVRSRHRLENAGECDLVIVEVAVGERLTEDDIVRYDDDFGR